MRILLVEGDTLTANSVELMLKSEGFNVYTTDLGEEGVQLAKLYEYDIAIFGDVRDMTPADMMRSVRFAKVKTSVLILSSICDVDNIVYALGTGADDYMTKPFHKDELVARINAIVRRSKGHAESLIKVDNVTLNVDTKVVTVDGTSIPMTKMEYRILELLALRKGIVQTKEQFLNHLYGGFDEPEAKIIDVFICKLRRKLSNAGAFDIVKTVWGRGYYMGEREGQASLGSDIRAASSEFGTFASHGVRG